MKKGLFWPLSIAGRTGEDQRGACSWPIMRIVVCLLASLLQSPGLCSGWSSGESLGLYSVVLLSDDEDEPDEANAFGPGCAEYSYYRGPDSCGLNSCGLNSCNLDSCASNSRDLYSSGPIIRGQAGSGYWDTVYTPYAQPTYIAQNTASAASTQPSITGGTTAITPAPAAAPAASNNGIIAMDPSSTAPPVESGFTQPINKVVRFCNNLMLDYTYLPRGSNNGLGIQDLTVNSRFTMPCNLLPKSTENTESNYFFIAPRFSVDFWSNTKEQWKQIVEMPTTFDASLAFGVHPQFSKEFSAEAWIQLGVASSFKKVDKDSFYIRGMATGTLVITEDGKFQATGGVKYLCRNRYKLLPVAGVIWKPNEKNEWRIVFPDPRLSHHLGKHSETDWWGYVRGDIGGGRWLVKNIFNDYSKIDYNDYRVALGLSFVRPSSFTGHIEVGGAFARELYGYGEALYKPKSSVFLSAGLGF